MLSIRKLIKSTLKHTYYENIHIVLNKKEENILTLLMFYNFFFGVEYMYVLLFLCY